ncbi:hypothetical protein PAV_17c00010 [Paenibacillus alvei DSM 29]|uniref:hypothetical protein n=1 Tax=Paenibacillus alvei TaxID=44250 RepID=UPI000289E476|nr:hypothetical protein [Paenibacillus alvei]EJW14153.1 hypothetical protein PAV_17c00010 [Paenibacillus alvei DSM 29]
MTNPIQIVKVPVTLDKERTLCYDLNAFIALEGIYGSEKKRLMHLCLAHLKRREHFYGQVYYMRMKHLQKKK